jgi:hypothetical protein
VTLLVQVLDDVGITAEDREQAIQRLAPPPPPVIDERSLDVRGTAALLDRFKILMADIRKTIKQRRILLKPVGQPVGSLCAPSQADGLISACEPHQDFQDADRRREERIPEQAFIQVRRLRHLILIQAD